eukprot:TRINITY_DN431_c5_g1_i1.p1 TRINITY_DN431_c5_g1~~TRINITY_DN431_c5_g1_i1.p1  ORF type:complete len:792 (+),score=166.72 TRINITY_DN431_c5_g1_i1:51-2426(+)
MMGDERDATFLSRFRLMWISTMLLSVVAVAMIATRLPDFLIYIAVVLVVGNVMLTFGRMQMKWLLDMDEGDQKMKAISEPIKSGAEGYLQTQYGTIAKMSGVVGGMLFLVFFLRATKEDALKISNLDYATVTVISFFIGASFSACSGYIGMWMAVRVNSRVASAASKLNYADSLILSLKGGLVSGILVVSLCVLGLTLLFCFLHIYFGSDTAITSKIPTIVVGYGFGASLVALFAQLGGGIYTKAADVGADMVGKIEAGIPEDDPRNPAVIADLVGDNVGDCAGRGADLFESITGEILGAMILGSQLASDAGISHSITFMFFPVMVHVFDVLISTLAVALVKPRGTHKFAPLPDPETGSVKDPTSGMEDPLVSLERGYNFSLLFAFIEMGVLCRWLLYTDQAPGSWFRFYLCAVAGIITAWLFVQFTKYYTDYNYAPVKSIAAASVTGHGTNVIAGLAVGLESTCLPTLTVGAAMIFSYTMGQNCGLKDLKTGEPTGGLFGTAVATMGMLSTAVYILAMDTFGPITDNAGGIVEMSNQSEAARVITDRLDAVGNVTKATTKGYSIGAAALASFLLLRAFLDIVEEHTGKLQDTINLAVPEVFVAGMTGAALIFLFSGMAMTAVGKAAGEVVKEVRHQFHTKPGIMEGTELPDYERCVAIVTASSLSEMIKPGLLAVSGPILVGVAFRLVGQATNRPYLGVECVSSMLLFATSAGVLMALFLNNAGGAWDNAKKYVEAGYQGGKGSLAHQSAVTGDTVGDPCKDTAGPSIHVLIKLLSTITLVACPLFLPSS